MDAPSARVPRSRSPRTAERDRTGQRPSRSNGGGRALFANAVWRTAPHVLAGALAVAGATHLLPAPPIAVPLRMIVVVAVLLLGIGATVILDRAGARPYWQMVLAVVLIQMPVVALQSSALREPFVALGRGSAGPAIWLTLACLLVLLGLWIFALLQQTDPPENAALLLLLPALIVPAILGAGSDLDETASLAMFGEAALLAGVAMFFALACPAGWRPIIATATFIMQFVGLWLFGRGPVIGPEAGLVPYVSLGVVLAATLIMVIAAPLGAVFTRRFFQTVEEKSGAQTPVSVPKRGARRRSDV